MALGKMWKDSKPLDNIEIMLFLRAVYAFCEGCAYPARMLYEDCAKKLRGMSKSHLFYFMLYLGTEKAKEDAPDMGHVLFVIIISSSL